MEKDKLVPSYLNERSHPNRLIGVFFYFAPRFQRLVLTRTYIIVMAGRIKLASRSLREAAQREQASGGRKGHGGYVSRAHCRSQSAV